MRFGQRLINHYEFVGLNRLHSMIRSSLLAMPCRDMIRVDHYKTRLQGPFPQSLFLTRYDTL